MFRRLLILLFFVNGISIMGQNKLIPISIDGSLSGLGYNSVVPIDFTLFGADTNHFSIKCYDTLMFDFTRSASYNIKMTIYNHSISIDSIGNDITSISVIYIPSSSYNCKYEILRDKTILVPSFATHCFGSLRSCDHVVIVRAGSLKIPVLADDVPRAYRSQVPTRYFIDGMEVTEE